MKYDFIPQRSSYPVASNGFLSFSWLGEKDMIKKVNNWLHTHPLVNHTNNGRLLAGKEPTQSKQDWN